MCKHDGVVVVVAVVMIAVTANAIVKKLWVVLKSESLGYNTSNTQQTQQQQF
jgi:hypothetical protein